MLIARESHAEAVHELTHELDDAIVRRGADRALAAEHLRHEQLLARIRAVGRFGQLVAQRVALGAVLYDRIAPQTANRTSRTASASGRADATATASSSCCPIRTCFWCCRKRVSWRWSGRSPISSRSSRGSRRSRARPGTTRFWPVTSCWFATARRWPRSGCPSRAADGAGRRTPANGSRAITRGRELLRRFLALVRSASLPARAQRGFSAFSMNRRVHGPLCAVDLGAPSLRTITRRKSRSVYLPTLWPQFGAPVELPATRKKAYIA